MQPDSISISDNAESLVRAALKLGAVDAACVSPETVAVEDALAALCNGDMPCPNYGLSASCPPHVPGPEQFRQWLAQTRFCVAMRMDIPSAAVFSDDRRDIGRLLHELVSGVEQKAVVMGYKGARGFAGGSCKQIFCHDQTDCRVVSGNGHCRHPQWARPSMSGFGINVGKLMQAEGWPAAKADPADARSRDAMTWLAGLVLIIDNDG